MHPDRFDELARHLALGTPRRAVVAGLAASMASAVLPTPWWPAMAATNPRPSPVCRGDRRCASYAFDTATGAIAPGRCPPSCSAATNLVRAGLRADWRRLLRELTRRGFRLGPRFGDPRTVLFAAATGTKLFEESIVTWVKPGGEAAHLVHVRALAAPAGEVAYVILRPATANRELLVDVAGTFVTVTLAQIKTAVADIEVATQNAATAAAAAQENVGSGSMSTVWCTSTAQTLCSGVSYISCDYLFGRLFGLAMKFGSGLFADVGPLLAQIGNRIDELATVVLARLGETQRRILADAMKKLLSNDVFGRKVDPCGDLQSASCDDLNGSGLFNACCGASGGSTCGTVGLCCRDGWTCNPRPGIGSFCSCPSGVISDDGLCCQAGEIACAKGCVPAGGCCPEDVCPDGTCRDANGVCGGSAVCGTAPCQPGTKCCRGSTVNACIPETWDCCSTGGGCPPPSFCCTRDGVVGCCL